MADAYKDRREAYARLIKGKAYADFRELLARNDIDAVVIATPDHWHVPIAIAAARAKKDAYVEKPLGREHRAGPRLPQGVRRERPHLPVRHAAAEPGALPLRLRAGPQRADRQGPHDRGRSPPTAARADRPQVVPVPPNLDYDMWCGPAPVRPYTADRCHPPGTYWIYDYSIGYLGGWGAHPLDIMVWGSDADLAGPMTVEGTGEIPAKGLYDTVYNWDMKIQIGRRREDDLQARRRLDEVHRPRRLGAHLARRHRRRAEVAA